MSGLRHLGSETTKEFIKQALEFENFIQLEMLEALAAVGLEQDLNMILDEIFKFPSKIKVSYLPKLADAIIRRGSIGLNTYLDYIIRNKDKAIINIL